MPWKAADAPKYNKAARSRRDKATWASVANNTRQACIDAGGSSADCDAQAIRAANMALQRRHREDMTKAKADLVEVTKRIGGVDYPTSSFLVVEDPESPTTWHLPVKSPDGTPDHRLMGAAWAALHGGFRGNRYEGPGKTEAIAKLRRLYDSEGMETPAESDTTEEQAGDPIPGYDPEPEAETAISSEPEEPPQTPEPEIAEVGRRLQSKQIASLKAAAEAIDALLKWAEYGDRAEDEPEEETPESNTAEGYQSLGSKQSDILQAFWREYCEGDPGEMPEYFPLDVLEAHPQLGDVVIARATESGLVYAVPYVFEEGNPVMFGMPPWAKVVATYAPVGVSGPPEVEPEPEEPEEAIPQASTEEETTPVADPTPEAEPTEEVPGTPVEEATSQETAPEQDPVQETEEPQEEPEETSTQETVPSLESDPDPVIEGATLSESEGLIMEAKNGGDAPLAMDVILIRPGWGNTRDNHYYPAEMLRRDAKVFEGAKMYETDHVQAEKNTHTWVSTVERIKGFTEEGAPIARVVVHDPGFAARIKALSEAKLLSRMECSILATGAAVKGKAPDGKSGKIVERITDALAVDWVTRAGAGGQAVALTEGTPTPGSISVSEQVPVAPPPAPLPEMVSIREIEDILETRPGLPKPVKDRVMSGKYLTTEAVREAIAAEIAYIKAVTGSGAPFELVKPKLESTPVKKITAEEYEARMAKIIEKYS